MRLFSPRMEIARWLGEWHPRLVPFPVVLLLTALLLDAVGLVWRNERAHWTGKLLMGLGTASLLLAFLCGICAEIWAGRSGVPHEQIEWHELAANVAAWGFVALTAWRLYLDPSKGGQRGVMTAYVVCGIAFYAMIAVTGYLGGKLVQDYGASVSGAQANTVISLHDLNTLAQRQTDKNLQYSDMMHHIFGWLVLVLCGTLFVRELRPHKAVKLRWVGPGLLLGGGVFLLFCADLDLYALTDARQFYDREVQVHKLISIILMGVGIWGLAKIREASDVESKSASLVHSQARLVAVLALIGGALLFTHIHTVAPYANVAAGVYINHIAMGFVALAIGTVKLFDDALPNRRKLRTLLFPSLMTLEAVLLITYTEGIPWWAGIGHYNRWGPNSGTIAPFGKERAELVVDPANGDVDLRVLERFEDGPVLIAQTNIAVVISQRYQETAVPLDAVDANGPAASHFHGNAAFLKGAVQLGARVSLPLNGEWRTGYFDPWVTPVIAGIPPNKVARYTCPMHDGIQSTDQGKCPLCGMPLVPIRTGIRKVLHDDKYGMQLAFDSGHPAAQKSVTLRFTPQFATSGDIVRDLLVVHEHLLHLIVVREDLSSFDHVHPVRQPDGSFSLPYTFPHGGRFVLYADITPNGERAQVFRLPVNVEGAAGIPDPISLSPALAREVGSYHVELFVQPRGLVAEREAQLLFRLSRNGRPVTDLQPYIGALGHCVILSEDTQTYLHCHPEQFTPTPPASGGPDVSFHTLFPRPGRYKIWGQFKHGDEVVVADFVVNVEKPILPRWLVTALITR